jgi:hypothetical protein
MMKTMELRPCNRGGDSLAVAFTRVLAAALLVIALIAVGARAQSHEDLERATPPPAPTATAQIVDPYATAGPKIYITDAAGRLATVTLGTYTVRIIGSEGVVLTDIGFNSKDHQLYGVSFTSLYRLNLTTGRATFVGNLGIPDAKRWFLMGKEWPTRLVSTRPSSTPSTSRPVS